MNKLNMINVYAFLAGLVAMQMLMMFTRYMTAGNDAPNPFAKEYQQTVADQPHSPLPWVANAPLQVGMLMPDGTIYAGISPDTRAPIYTTKKDFGEIWKFSQARDLCMKLSSYDSGSWRLPTKGELELLYRHRGDIGGFHTDDNPFGWYWSSSSFFFTAWKIRFSNGSWFNDGKTFPANIRCVRDESPEQMNAEAAQAAQVEPAAGGGDSAVAQEQPQPPSSEGQPLDPQTAPEAYQRAILGKKGGQ